MSNPCIYYRRHHFICVGQDGYRVTVAFECALCLCYSMPKGRARNREQGRRLMNWMAFGKVGLRVAKKPGSPQPELIKRNGPAPRAKGGKKFADLLWPDGVLTEKKSRGEKLERSYDQAFDYWSHIVPYQPTVRHPAQVRRVLDLRPANRMRR